MRGLHAGQVRACQRSLPHCSGCHYIAQCAFRKLERCQAWCAPSVKSSCELGVSWPAARQRTRQHLRTPRLNVHTTPKVLSANCHRARARHTVD
jgi:hypothetical protein